MSVTNQTPIGAAIGNGVTTAFPFTYYIAAASDLVVKLEGATLTLGADYTVTGAGNLNGGTINMTAAPAIGARLAHYRDTALTRATDYQDGGDLLAPVLNLDFDRLWLALQEIFSGGKGAPTAVRVPAGETIPELPPALTRADRLLGFNSLGQPIATLPTPGDATALALDLASTATGKGAALVGFKQTGAMASTRTALDKLRERISVSDFASLSFTHAAKTPGDPNSRFATSFTSWRLAIQAAIDEAYARGGATVVVDAGPDGSHPVLLVDNYITVKSNVRMEFEAPIKLGDYTTIGGLLILDGENIEIHNPMLDGSGIFAGASGENGICPLSGDNQKIYGGEVKDFARGNTGGQFGGKGFQVEGGTCTNVLASGTTVRDCFMAMSTLHDYTESTTTGPVRFTSMFVEDCEILLFVRQSGGSDVTGAAHSVVLENFTAKNVGGFEGAIHLSRAANVLVADGLIVNSASINSFIRGNHRFCEFRGLTLSGACSQIINLDPSTYATDSSSALENNQYDIKHTGTAGYVANSSLGTPFRTLQDCQMEVQLQNDVSTKIVGDELRNGYCRISGQQGAKSFDASAADLFTLGLAKFANFPAGHSLYAANAGAYSFNLPAAPLSFADASGGGVTFSTNSGDWTKIGRMAFVSINLTFNATANGAANLISGLPFPAISNARGTVGFALRFTDLTQSNVSVSVNSASSSFQIVGAGALLANSSLSGKTISGVISYMTS